MAEIIPFRAVRPSADKVALVTTRPYDDYSAAELASWLDFNPFSFLHIINPAFINQQKIDPVQRYQIVAKKYADFLNKNILIKEEKSALYLYEIQTTKNTFIGILAGTSIEDYQNNIIKKHENTLAYRVDNLKEYFKQAKFNTEPVLIMHPQNNELQQFIEQKKETSPIYDFSTTNRERHIVWMIDEVSEIKKLQKIFGGFDNLYIADGHHRSASSYELLKEKGTQASEAMNYFMSYLICESKIKVNEYNRLIHDLNGYSTQEFIKIISEKYTVEKVHE